ncbi:MAG TPA: hypothetical protein VM581_03510 [Magnetospirillaceae bacterium]|nr:hypothetical protein [Magnetospirillaceae bacterium]
MTEQDQSHEHYARLDPELEVINERLGTVVEVLDYVESPQAGEARRQLVAQIIADNGFDKTNPRHHELLEGYELTAEKSLAGGNNQRARIGYEVAKAQLWLELDDADKFLDLIYGPEGTQDEGVIAQLRWMYLHETADELLNIIADLRGL